MSLPQTGFRRLAELALQPHGFALRSWTRSAWEPRRHDFHPRQFWKAGTPMAGESWGVPGVEPTQRGKVRDLYDLGDKLLLVATDRVSAFDLVLPEAIPHKGAILTCLSKFWFDQLGDQVQHHLLSVDPADLPEPFQTAARQWGPRFMLVEKLEMLSIECVVRGYLAGSGWKEYQKSGTVCGIGLPTGLVECSELEHPLFTPSTKATDGHDENISVAEAEKIVGTKVAKEVERLSLQIYEFGRTFARERGLILADTKFEFGLRPNGDVVPVLGDEVLTPDSSRYWPADQYRPGSNPPSFDKQFVRDYLADSGWDKTPPAPGLPAEVIQGTQDRYMELWQRLTDTPWKP